MPGMRSIVHLEGRIVPRSKGLVDGRSQNWSCGAEINDITVSVPVKYSPTSPVDMGVVLLEPREPKHHQSMR